MTGDLAANNIAIYETLGMTSQRYVFEQKL